MASWNSGCHGMAIENSSRTVAATSTATPRVIGALASGGNAGNGYGAQRLVDHHVAGEVLHARGGVDDDAMRQRRVGHGLDVVRQDIVAAIYGRQRLRRLEQGQ